MTLPGEDVLRLPVTRTRPKGLAPWTPRPRSKRARILIAAEAVLDRFADRLPLGPREIGYVLTGAEYGFTKADIDEVEEVLVRARRAEIEGFSWGAISDGRTGTARPWTVDNADKLAQQVHGSIERAQYDRQEGQDFRVEMWAEAMGWLPRLERICNERGVSVYSGSGSVPVPAIRQAALRAIAHHPSTTVLLSVGDLDLNGIRNIARPFAEDVVQFVIDTLQRSYGFSIEQAHEKAGEIIVVRRLLLTAEQVEQHVGEQGRGRPNREAIKAGWPYKFTAQAEALPPDLRDQIVTDAIDALHDVTERERIIGTEAALHADARKALAKLLRNRKP